jgi:hypothetical protein
MLPSGVVPADTLAPFEGYGAAAAWQLRLGGTDLVNVADVVLHLEFLMPSPNLDLQQDVDELIVKYENELRDRDQLDAVSAFSLRDRFGDALDGLLKPPGQADVTLAATDLPRFIEDFSKPLSKSSLKTIIFQARDAGGRPLPGLSLHITRDGTELDLKRTTRGEDGFSEDLEHPAPPLPRASRFPVAGTYHLQLLDPPPPAPLAELTLFFVYEYERQS